MGIKKKLFLFFLLFHITLVILNGLEALYLTVSEIDNRFSSSVIDRGLSIKDQIRLPTLYSKYTGINTGYGFFAPNVKGTGFVSITSCEVEEPLQAKTYEGEVRLSSFESNLLDDILKRKAETKVDSFQNALYDLIYYQLTQQHLKITSCISDTVSISFVLEDIDRFETFRQTGNVNQRLQVVRRYYYETQKK